MKSVRLFLFFISLIAFQVFAFDFTKDGKPVCVIAVPEKCSDLEIMAKDDLAGILKKITGADFQIVPENQVKGPAVYLGFTNYARKNGADFTKLENEEWLIKTSGKNLILTGGGIVGPYYAVQALHTGTTDRHHRYCPLHGQERKAKGYRHHLSGLYGSDDRYGSDVQLHVLPENRELVC